MTASNLSWQQIEKLIMDMPPPPEPLYVAVRASHQSIAELKAHVNLSDEADAVALQAAQFMGLRLHVDVSMHEGVYVPMTVEQERAWLDLQHAQHAARLDEKNRPAW